MLRISRSILFGFLIALFSIFIVSADVFAANATISVSPSSGSYGKEFDVNVIIDGHGDIFNAAGATASISSNLVVKDLVLGNCNFSFTHTPTIANPSFEGIILGGSNKKCTAYTITLIPAKKGNASITFSNSTIRRYGDAVNIFKSAQGGEFMSLSDNPNALSLKPNINTPQNGLYSIQFNVTYSNNTPAKNTLIELITVGNTDPIKKITDEKGMVQFLNLKKGVYQATAENQKTIINLSGNSHVIVLGIRLQPKKNYWIVFGSGILIISLLTIFIIIFVKKSSRKSVFS